MRSKFSNIVKGSKAVPEGSAEGNACKITGSDFKGIENGVGYERIGEANSRICKSSVCYKVFINCSLISWPPRRGHFNVRKELEKWKI